MDPLLAIILGVGLSAASGFRVFVPPLVMSAAARSGWLELPAQAAWMESPLALVIFAVATAIEVTAYYIPLVDNLLDTVMGPAAVVAGVLITSVFAAELDPALRWTVAVLAGGGAAAGIQGLTSLFRLTSLGTTGGLGNPVVSTAENVGGVGLSLLAIALPVLALALVIALLLLGVRGAQRLRKGRKPRSDLGSKV